MYKFIRFLDDTVDRALTLILILLMLIGVYFIYDTAYVYYHASAARVQYHRPGAAETVEEDVMPLAEGFVAWLTLDNSNVDFPVMQGKDNNEFLNTDPYGDFSLAGSIFLDYRNTADFTDPYSLLYGHHMSGGFMFGALDRFYDESYFAEHVSGTLTVNGLVYPLQTFAVVTTTADDEVIFIPGESGKVLKTAPESAIYYRDPVSEHVLALTTCVDSVSVTRTVVLCAMGEPYPEGRDGP